jgi:hypothetical protein
MSREHRITENYSHVVDEKHASYINNCASDMAASFAGVATFVVQEEKLDIRDGTLAALYGSLLFCDAALSSFGESRVDDEMYLTMIHEAAEYFNNMLINAAGKIRKPS